MWGREGSGREGCVREGGVCEGGREHWRREGYWNAGLSALRQRQIQQSESQGRQAGISRVGERSPLRVAPHHFDLFKEVIQ